MDVICPVCNTQFRLRSLYYKNKRNCCSKRCKFKWMKDVGYLKGKSGGYREGAGRGKSGWYKGIFCNSTYELAWVIYNLENNIPFKRNDDAFEYTDSNGINRKYYPDFYLTDEKCYVEIKGYKEKEFENKQRAFPHKIILIDKHDIKKYINYVKEKYGNNFIELYEGNPHNNKLNKCEICGQQCKNKFCSRSCAGKSIGNKAHGYNQYDRKF